MLTNFREAAVPPGAAAADVVSRTEIPLVSGGSRSGHHDELARDPLGLLQRAAAEAVGGLAQLSIGNRPFLVVSTHTAAADVLEDTSRAFAKPKMGSWRRLLGGSLLCTNGADWARARRRVRLVAGPATAEIARSAARVAVRCSNAWPVDGEVALLPEMRAIALGSAFELLTGSAPDLDVPAFTAALDTVLRHIQEVESTPDRKRCGGQEAFEESVRNLRRQVDPMALRWSTEVGGSRLLRPAGPEAYRGYPERAVDDLLGYLVAGYESTATTLTWSILLLAEHPDEQAAVRGGHRDAERSVVAEALRLYPPAWALLRAAVRPTAVGGVPVPPGALVLCSPYLIHRDPVVFPRPTNFAPSRWDKPHPDLPRHAYVPFGSGQRACPGRTMAATGTAAVLSTLAGRFEFRPSTAHPSPEVRVTLQPPLDTTVAVRRLPGSGRPSPAVPDPHADDRTVKENGNAI